MKHISMAEPPAAKVPIQGELNLGWVARKAALILGGQTWSRPEL